MRKLALISVYNKESLSSIARALEEKGLELVATGGTKTQLEAEGFKVTEVSEITGEPERFGGRVKTLNHKILGGILFRPGKDEKEWPYDFRVAAVVCNFYPFEKEAPLCQSISEVMEWVDVGGPTMVRAAAKNFPHVWLFTRPDQYTRFIASPDEAEHMRERFSLEAFEAVSHYDEAIVYELCRRQPWSKGTELRYGENPHQKARFLANRKLGPKFYGEFSYNNIRDAEAALRFASVFGETSNNGAKVVLPAVAVVKHQTLCGAAVGMASAKPDQVFNWAWEGDPVSRFGGVLALSFLPSPNVTAVLKKKFIELLVLPRSPESEKWAEDFVKEKDRVRILLVEHPWGEDLAKVQERHSGILGTVEQQSDSIDTQGISTDTKRLLQVFGQWAGACSKSNAMVLAGTRDNIAFMAGVGQGQPNRVDALKILALPRAKDFCARTETAIKDLTCFSDAFLPFDDCVTALNEAGVKKLVQPGGSKADEQVKQTAENLGVDMQMSQVRHFWH